MSIVYRKNVTGLLKRTRIRKANSGVTHQHYGLLLNEGQLRDPEDHLGHVVGVAADLEKS